MSLLAREAGIAADAGVAAGTLVEAALLAQDLGENGQAAHHLAALIERDPGNAEAAEQLRGVLGDEAPSRLATLYENAGAHHEDRIAFFSISGNVGLDCLEVGRVHGVLMAEAFDLFDQGGRGDTSNRVFPSGVDVENHDRIGQVERTGEVVE